MAIAECTNVLQDLRNQNPSMFSLIGALPSVDQLIFLFDLFEVSGDVQGLIDFISSTLIPEDEIIIPFPSSTTLIGSGPSKAILTIAMLRHYHACLSLMPELMAKIFRG